jgi:DNA-binding NarL/FixJ family response regulator
MTERACTATVLLVDDHALFRESIRRFLEAEANLDVVGSVGTVEEAGAVMSHEKKIDLVLLDYDLGERDGLDFMRVARSSGFSGKVLLVTAGIDPRKTAAMLDLGVAGVFLKHNPPEQLKRAILDVLAGNVWLERDVLQRVLQVTSGDAPHRSETRLTERESQVLSFVFDGLSNKQIADRLSVSESAIKATMQQLFQKTGVRTRSQLVRIALERLDRRGS